MTDRFTIALDDAELIRAIDRAAGKLRDPHALYDAIGKRLTERVELRFVAKRDPSGVPWPPLSEKTKAMYAKQDAGRRQGSLLDRTGRMRNSLTHNVLPDGVEVGFGVPYAAYHETGTRSKKGNPKMPRRALLTADWQAGRLGAGDRDAVLRLVQQYLDGLFAP